MGQVHMKGFILQLLAKNPDGLWDHEISKETLAQYDCTGDYWKSTVRVTLTDLYSGGLVEELEDRLDQGEHFGPGKVLVKFRLSDFGRSRMQDTGLL